MKYYCKYYLVILPKYALVEFMEYRKNQPIQKYKFGNRKFWTRGYLFDTGEMVKLNNERASLKGSRGRRYNCHASVVERFLQQKTRANPLDSTSSIGSHDIFGYMLHNLCNW